MVTSDSNRSKSGDEDQADMSRMGDDMASGGDFGQMIKDQSNVTGGKE